MAGVDRELQCINSSISMNEVQILTISVRGFLAKKLRLLVIYFAYCIILLIFLRFMKWKQSIVVMISTKALSE